MDPKDILCNHMQLTKEELEKAIRAKNLRTLEEVIDETDAGSICGSCRPDIRELLDEIWG